MWFWFFEHTYFIIALGITVLIFFYNIFLMMITMKTNYFRIDVFCIDTTFFSGESMI